MNISNVMGSADTSVVAASKKNKWKLTDSLKDKIAEMAKKDAQNNEYMGNEFKSLRNKQGCARQGCFDWKIQLSDRFWQCICHERSAGSG